MVKLSLSSQLLLLIAGVMAALTGTTLLSGEGLLKLADEVVTTGAATEKDMGRGYAILEAAAQMQAHLQVILGEKDPDIIEQKLAELQAQYTAVRKSLQECGTICATSLSKFDDLVTVNNKTVELFLGGNLADSYASVARDIAPKLGELLAEIRHSQEATVVRIRAKNVENGAAAKQRAYLALVLSITAALVVTVIGNVFRRRLSSRLATVVAGLRDISAGDFAQRLPEAPADELGAVGTTVNAMAARIGALLASIEVKNRELTDLNGNLELKVKDRTKAIRTILDNVTIGLFICDPKLTVREGHSDACGRLLDRSGNLAGQNLADILRLNSRDGGNFSILYEQIYDENSLIGALAVEQLPNRFVVGNRHLELVGSVICDDDGKPESTLFCLADITTLVQAEAENLRNQSLILMMSNRDGFRSFLTDAADRLRLATEAVSETSNRQLRTRKELHTLKGNFGFYGLKDLGDMVHQLEEAHPIAAEGIAALEQQLSAFVRTHSTILGVEYGVKAETTFVVPESLLRDFKSHWDQSDELGALRRLVTDFCYHIKKKQVGTLLGPIEVAVEKLAARLGKQVTFTFTGREILVADTVAAALRTLPHILRNALDHGLEAPSKRGTKGSRGALGLVVTEHDDAWQVVISDDGRGIDAGRLVAKAVAMGFVTPQAAASMSERETLHLMFLAGLSTTEETTDVSGRGIGMAAVEKDVLSAGGTIDVQSTPGKGTVFTIRLPKPLVAAAALPLRSAA